MTTLIKQNIATLTAQIRNWEQQYQRRARAVTLMAVSKTRNADEVRAAYAAGIRCVGENYLQEAEAKLDQLADLPDLKWHFIGPLQSNKTRVVAERFSWVHSVDRTKLAKRLSEQRLADLPPLNILLQLNISAEPSKSGCSIEDLPALAAECAALPNLCLRGLMVIPAASSDFDEQRQVFAKARHIFDELHLQYATVDTLSMGMSGDLQAAIAEGSTLVRLGTAIFGARNIR
jgi:pyridoxal phosphate enzyme (YggS family)